MAKRIKCPICRQFVDEKTYLNNGTCLQCGENISCEQSVVNHFVRLQKDNEKMAAIFGEVTESASKEKTPKPEEKKEAPVQEEIKEDAPAQAKPEKATEKKDVPVEKPNLKVDFDWEALMYGDGDGGESSDDNDSNKEESSEELHSPIAEPDTSVQEQVPSNERDDIDIVNNIMSQLSSEDESTQVKEPEVISKEKVEDNVVTKEIEENNFGSFDLSEPEYEEEIEEPDFDEPDIPFEEPEIPDDIGPVENVEPKDNKIKTDDIMSPQAQEEVKIEITPEVETPVEKPSTKEEPKQEPKQAQKKEKEPVVNKSTSSDKPKEAKKKSSETVVIKENPKTSSDSGVFGKIKGLRSKAANKTTSVKTTESPEKVAIDTSEETPDLTKMTTEERMAYRHKQKHVKEKFTETLECPPDVYSSNTKENNYYYNDTKAAIPPEPDVIKRSTILKVIGSVLLLLLFVIFMIYYV